MMNIKAGFFKVTGDEPVSVIEQRCKAFATSPPLVTPTIENSEGQKFVLKDAEWIEADRVFVATIWRVRGRALPSQWSDGADPTPVNSQLSEAVSFAYRPSHELMLMQHSLHGAKHNRAARLLEEAEILAICNVAPDITKNALQRMKDAAMVRRIEFGLVGIDAAKEAELRNAGLGGAIDEMRKYGGTSIHITISLGHTAGELNQQARGVVESLSEFTSGVRTVKAGVKDTSEHDVELLDLMNCRSKIEFEVEEVGRELDRKHCRDRLLYNLVNR